MSKTILISLIGGEPTGNYRAYKEFFPDILVHVYSSVTEKISERILSLVDTKKTQIIKIRIEGDNYSNILQELKQRITNIQPEDTVNVNVTGGTKMMGIAAVDFGKSIEDKCKVEYLYTDIATQQIHWFYKNKSETYCDDLTLEDFIKLAGQKIISKENFTDLLAEYGSVLSSIEHVKNDFEIFLRDFVSKVSKKENLPENRGKRVFNFYHTCLESIERKGFSLFWNKDGIHVRKDNQDFLKLGAPIEKVEWLLFHAGWFELQCAKKLAKKYPTENIFMNVKFPLLSNVRLEKNEVDILVVQNGKMIFVECKSGQVSSSDINNIKVRQETYGGIVTNSLLITRFELKGNNPSDKVVLEKCQDLKIEVIPFQYL
jgi:hypothetical protein